MVEREYSSDSAISQTGRAFTDKIDTNPKKAILPVNISKRKGMEFNLQAVPERYAHRCAG
jgi:hypothetical protein